ncbi:LysR family transcriptional regulator [Fusibacter sp. 3D3]|uniref:LysR substrate-binding domain-containing protein n=1 Tax=Fusibacter sp. 3D3 TaxID=1048380 RepID=UPI000853DFEF|nr:LysR family transcriptional regulator [Fusibacter sp. 3D3]GAU76383.1 transcriptional regulator [Fusibacter sp. 3D3]
MSFKGVTLLQIEYFLAVAEYLNFTEAAKRLYTSQPSLSKQISHMEKKLGVNLFYRTKRDVRLTAEGIILFNEINGVIGKIDQALQKCVDPMLESGSMLRIGCYDVMDTGVFLNQIIHDFKKIYPLVEIVIERHGFKKLRQKLDSGDLDTILTLSFEIDQKPGIIWDEIYKSSTCILMSIHHPLANKEGLSLSDFKAETFIMLEREESPNGYDDVIALCKSYGFVPRKVRHMPNVESQLLTIEAGEGIALTDDHIRIFRKANFRRCILKDDFLSVVMAWRVENRSPIVAVFNNYVLKQMGSIET